MREKGRGENRVGVNRTPKELPVRGKEAETAFLILPDTCLVNKPAEERKTDEEERRGEGVLQGMR